MRLAQRAERMAPFHVMEVAKAAALKAAQVAHSSRPMVYLNIGEPDFTAPPLVQEAAERAIRNGRTQYTPATGLSALRERISGWYHSRFGVSVAPERIVVTAGASAALQLACLALIETGDQVLMPDPCYPCNRQFVAAAGGEAVLLPTTAADRFQLNAAQVQAAWGPATRGVLLASPSNPTGTTIAPEVLADVLAAVRERHGFLVFDEIYNQLTYGGPVPRSALALGDDVIVINSFSKYFGMTGWRLGWLVLPEALVPAAEKLAMNLFICPPATAQYAALGCFEPESLAIYEQRRAEFARRRDYLVPALRGLGLDIPTEPDGAFYVYADVSRFGLSGEAFATRLLDEAGVCVVPGMDFGVHERDRWVRFTYATSMERLQEAVARIGAFLETLPRRG